MFECFGNAAQIADAAAVELLAQSLEGEDVGDAGLEPVVYDLREEVGPRRENEYGQRNAVAAEFDTFDRESDGKIVSPFGLEHGRELDGSVPVSICLDEHQEPGGRLQERAEIAVVAPAPRKAEFQS